MDCEAARARQAGRARRLVWSLLRASSDHVAVMLPPSSLAFSHQEGHPYWSRCGRRTRLQMIPPSLLVISQGWGLIDLPLRASNEGWFIWSISSIWFVWLVGPEIHPEEPDRPERPANQTDEPLRVARAQKIIRLHPLLCSASTRDGWASPVPLS